MLMRGNVRQRKRRMFVRASDCEKAGTFPSGSRMSASSNETEQHTLRIRSWAKGETVEGIVKSPQAIFSLGFIPASGFKRWFSHEKFIDQVPLDSISLRCLLNGTEQHATNNNSKRWRSQKKKSQATEGAKQNQCPKQQHMHATVTDYYTIVFNTYNHKLLQSFLEEERSRIETIENKQKQRSR